MNWSRVFLKKLKIHFIIVCKLETFYTYTLKERIEREFYLANTNLLPNAAFVFQKPQKVFYPPVKSQTELEELIKTDALPDQSWTLVNYKMLHTTSKIFYWKLHWALNLM